MDGTTAGQTTSLGRWCFLLLLVSWLIVHAWHVYSILPGVMYWFLALHTWSSLGHSVLYSCVILQQIMWTSAYFCFRWLLSWIFHLNHGLVKNIVHDVMFYCLFLLQLLCVASTFSLDCDRCNCMTWHFNLCWGKYCFLLHYLTLTAHILHLLLFFHESSLHCHHLLCFVLELRSLCVIKASQPQQLPMLSSATAAAKFKCTIS